MNLFPVFLHLLYLALPAFASETAYVIMAVTDGELAKISLSPGVWLSMEKMPVVTAQYIKDILGSMEGGSSVSGRIYDNSELFFWKRQVQDPYQKFSVAYKNKIPESNIREVDMPAEGYVWLLKPHVMVLQSDHDLVHLDSFFKESFVAAATKPNGDITCTSAQNRLLNWLDHDTTQTDP
eukprot:GHVS01088673.1.p1 GENE.GHVS01088673.1~~GHVS01088673.1.p1  ORF type:complete len:180 (+),score=14.34 GHVS01088673.1:154-693(+)